MIALNRLRIRSLFVPARVFMVSAMLVNAGNYLYNLLLSRILGPARFADAAILVTFLLVLSFVAMTLQLTVAKFTGSFEDGRKDTFLSLARKWSLWTGFVIGVLVFVLAESLAGWFQTGSAWMFRIFALGIPIYFLMSVNRGNFQGEQEFLKLSFTYQAEMFSRLLLSLLFLAVLPFGSSELVALGIFCSFIPGLLPYKKLKLSALPKMNISEVAHLKKFLLVTAFYELTQILINNGDLLLVKHFFEAETAGLYASVALIGRGVYFVAWMFVMLLLPEVVRLQRQGKNTNDVLFKHLFNISLLGAAIVLVTYIFPELVISMLFGDAYLEAADILWKYALASLLFALANIFVYYFLSLDRYVPVLLSGIMGLVQLLAISYWHGSLAAVVHIQLLLMGVLLLLQVWFFFYRNK
ncbi:oligosaccharide flippase family protein [Christiangramia flava]|uniref:Capsular polysaccharide biosynthesis protein n=1 Tax=Christiangramia flava JLT2011 TaxID=1229726 RepID=A0A1L7I5X2_9FLAO|nr:oligosaccharide flippase family protein [Christiangramia flava]APU68998.1 Capsular polysaccharide biosynthesis protein [Christiangramia flava JLT2011]OSS38528.1 Capsular polysaccharide biosynthesis protein [Christiangramia flava JLT2011]